MKKKMTHVHRFVLFVILLVLLYGIAFAWWKDGTSPVNPSNTISVEFVIEKNESIRTIASRLSQEKLIRSPTAFFMMIKLMGIERNIQAGYYRLNQAMDASTVARELTHGVEDAQVTTLEGWRVEEIALELARSLEIPESEFLKYAAEGYMFPDTYLISKDSSASSVVGLFRRTFDEKARTIIREFDTPAGLSEDEVIILASIVEREGKSEHDRPIIAGILLNRLREGWPLQADATLQYAIGYRPETKSWWKQQLFNEDKQVDSPYNTYLHTGLPPTPICSPGLSSIRAVVNPQPTDYMYYLHDPEGNVHFARTLEEHEANIASYLD